MCSCVREEGKSFAISGRLRSRGRAKRSIAAQLGVCILSRLIVPDSGEIPACAGCGKCCHLLVELQPLLDDVPEEMVVEHSGVRCMEQMGDGACVALDPITRLCTIYERRPQVCRDFKRAEELCRRIVMGRLGPEK